MPKRRSGVAKAAAALVLAILIAPPPVCAAAWRAFANARFGFSLEVPATFRAGPPLENGDGRRFTSPDGAVTLAAYGHLLSRPGDLRADAEATETFERQDGVSITYRSIGANRYALSGTAAGRIVYIATVMTCGGETAATVRIDYPAALKASLDPIVAHAAGSLRGSARCS